MMGVATTGMFTLKFAVPTKLSGGSVADCEGQSSGVGSARRGEGRHSRRRCAPSVQRNCRSYRDVATGSGDDNGIRTNGDAGTDGYRHGG